MSDAIFGSGTGPWAQISWEGTIFDAKHDNRKNFPILDKFFGSRAVLEPKNRIRHFEV